MSRKDLSVKDEAWIPSMNLRYYSRLEDGEVKETLQQLWYVIRSYEDSSVEQGQQWREIKRDMTGAAGATIKATHEHY
jgi:hypothetical protein